MGSQRMRLFAYGTLLRSRVVEALLGRVPPSYEATLAGYERCRLAGRVYPGLVSAPGRTVSGVVYADLAAAELQIIDRFEGDGYERRIVRVESGGLVLDVFAYVIGERYAHLVQRGSPWSLDDLPNDWR